MPVAQNLRREVLDGAVLVDQARGAHFADAVDAGIAVCVVADEREEVGDARDRRRTFRVLRRRSRSGSCAGASGRRDRPPRTARGPCPASRCRLSARAHPAPRGARRARRVIGFKLDHRPDATPIAASASSSGWNCARSAGSIPRARFVAGIEAVAERLDHMVGRHADVRRALLDHLQHGVQDADHRGVRRIFAFVDAADRRSDGKARTFRRRDGRSKRRGTGSSDRA